MPKTIEVPVPYLQTLLLTLYRYEQANPDDEDLDLLISGLNTALLDHKVHPHQKLIDAGLFEHLLP